VVDPIGPENNRMIFEMTTEARTVYLAYGHPPKALRQHGEEAVTLLRNHSRLYHLRLAKDGPPVHLFYLPEILTPHHIM